MFRPIAVGLIFFGGGWFWFCYTWVVKDSRRDGKEPLQLGFTVGILMLMLPRLFFFLPDFMAVISGLVLTYALGYFFLRKFLYITPVQCGKVLLGHFVGCAIVIGVPAGMLMVGGGWL